jgi:Predicted nucleotide-binding protein containing TIR-like domain
MAQGDLRHCSEPELWTNSKFLSQDTPIESLFRTLDEFKLALFVALAEDITTKGGSEHYTMRDNVLFEMGLFLGRHGRKNVFLIAPRGLSDAKLQLPTDLTGIQPCYFDASATNLQSAVSSSLLELKEALRAFSPKTIFDARRNLRAGHLVNIGSKKHDKFGTPISVEATANFNLTDDALEVTRTNSDGTWNIEVRPNGMSAPTISRSLTTERSVRIHFEAKIDGAEHNIRCVSLDANTRDWIENRLFHVREREWKNFSAELNAPSNLDILVRLQDELEHPPRGTLYIRNIVVTQPES